jgi:hypothetical protein
MVVEFDTETSIAAYKDPGQTDILDLSNTRMDKETEQRAVAERLVMVTVGCAVSEPELSWRNAAQTICVFDS